MVAQKPLFQEGQGSYLNWLIMVLHGLPGRNIVVSAVSQEGYNRQMEISFCVCIIPRNAAKTANTDFDDRLIECNFRYLGRCRIRNSPSTSNLQTVDLLQEILNIKIRECVV